jgi:formate hydrogenlyase subunit 3/multisubunit Na+/H+ antiporter MnhD subunit
VALAVFLMSLTGLPPTAGFVGKLYIFAALINGGWTWLAIVAALNSVIALYYYVRVFRNMFLRAEETSSPRITLSGVQNAALLVLLVPTLLLGSTSPPSSSSRRHRSGSSGPPEPTLSLRSALCASLRLGRRTGAIRPGYVIQAKQSLLPR